MVVGPGFRTAVVAASVVLLAGLAPGVASAEAGRDPDRSHGGFQDAPEVVGVGWTGPLVVGWLNYDRSQKYRVEVTGAGDYAFTRELWIPEGTSIRRAVRLDPPVSAVGDYRAVFRDAEGDAVYGHRFRAAEPVDLRTSAPARSFLPRVRDGIRDTVGVGYSLDRPAQVLGRVLDRRGRVRQVVDLGLQQAGDHRWTWSGFARGGVVDRGRYTLRLTARADGLDVSRSHVTTVASYRAPVDRAVRRLGAQTDRRSPGDCRLAGGGGAGLVVDCSEAREGARLTYRFTPGRRATRISTSLLGDGFATRRDAVRSTRTRAGHGMRVVVRVAPGTSYTVRAVRASYTARVMR